MESAELQPINCPPQQGDGVVDLPGKLQDKENVPQLPPLPKKMDPKVLVPITLTCLSMKN
jgi:hypothetical protein